MGLMADRKKCWICDADARTGEHRTKSSDIRTELGTPTPERRFFVNADLPGGHGGRIRNYSIASLKNDVLKFPDKLCVDCNTARTQAFDVAWERLSSWLRSNVTRTTTSVRAVRVFPWSVEQEMIHVHLFFVKLFGCLVTEDDWPIELRSFAQALTSRKPHPNVYLKFGQWTDGDGLGSKSVGLWRLPARDLGSFDFIPWFYTVGPISVNVMLSQGLQAREGLVGAWHPRTGTYRLRIATFGADETSVETAA